MRDFDFSRYLFPKGRNFQEPRHPSYIDSVLGPEHIADADVAFIGVPFDGGSHWHVGTNFGPQGIRKGISYFRGHSAELQIEIAQYLKVVDIGDVDCDLNSYERTFSYFDKVLGAVIDKGLVPICFGGDHSISYQAIKTFLEHTKKPTGIIFFDTDTDVHTDYRGDPYHCGCPMYRVLTEMDTYVKPQNVVQIGIHGFRASSTLWSNAKKLGYNIILAEDVHTQGMIPVIKSALAKASNNTEQIYLTVDIDVMDSAFAPGTEVATPGGLTPSQILTAVRLSALHGCSAFDICEVAPPVDVGDITVKTAGAIVLEFLSGLAERKRASKERKTEAAIRK